MMMQVWLTGHRERWQAYSPRSTPMATKFFICLQDPSVSLQRQSHICNHWGSLNHTFIIEYKFHIFSQGNLQLPPGPLFLNPESALKSFKREVIDKQPQIFKIRCLSVLQKLFIKNPFFAGYGNKPTDVTAYEQVGIPTSHIFIINKSGNLKHQVSETIYTSYKDQCKMVDYFFPPVSKALVSSENFKYWNDPMPNVDLDKLLWSLLKIKPKISFHWLKVVINLNYILHKIQYLR